MTPPDDPLRALDAAWEALADAVRACLGNGDAAAEHVAAHRPLIEALALQQPARSEGLDEPVVPDSIYFEGPDAVRNFREGWRAALRPSVPGERPAPDASAGQQTGGRE